MSSFSYECILNFHYICPQQKVDSYIFKIILFFYFLVSTDKMATSFSWKKSLKNDNNLHTSKNTNTQTRQGKEYKS